MTLVAGRSWGATPASAAATTGDAASMARRPAVTSSPAPPQGVITVFPFYPPCRRHMCAPVPMLPRTAW